MKRAFRLAAVVLAAGIATDTAASQKAAGLLPAYVMGPAATPQSYLSAPSWENVPSVLSAGYAFEAYRCHGKLQKFQGDLASFKRVKQFCVDNTKAIRQTTIVIAKAEATFLAELIDLAAAESYDKADRATPADLKARHAYIGERVADMIRNRRELSKANARQFLYKDVATRFDRMFPRGITVMPLPVASAAVYGP